MDLFIEKLLIFLCEHLGLIFEDGSLVLLLIMFASSPIHLHPSMLSASLQ